MTALTFPNCPISTIKGVMEQQFNFEEDGQDNDGCKGILGLCCWVICHYANWLWWWSLFFFFFLFFLAMGTPIIDDDGGWGFWYRSRLSWALKMIKLYRTSKVWFIYKVCAISSNFFQTVQKLSSKYILPQWHSVT